MKIIVDEMPKSPYECPFAKYEYGAFSCKLKTGVCSLDRNRKCRMLLNAKDLKGDK